MIRYQESLMRRFPYIIAAVLVFLIAGYSVFWYMQAQRAKAVFVDIATHLPEQTRKTGNEFTLKYDDVGVGGYPLSYRVIFKNPVLSWKEVSPSGMVGFSEKIPEAANLAPLNTMKLTGELALESDYIASAFSAAATGTVDSTMKTPEGPISWQSQWDGANTFSIAFNEEGRKRLLSGENPFALLQDPDSLMRTLRGVSVHADNFSVKRMPDGKRIFFVPDNDIDFSINPLDDINAEVTLNIVTKDMVLTKEYGQLVSAFYLLNGQKDQPAPTFRQFDERAGKTSIDVDLSAKGPFLARGAALKDYTLDIDSRQFSIRNDWYEITLPMSLHVKKTAAANSLSLKHEGKIHFSKQMEQALRDDYITSGRAYAELKRLFNQPGAEAPPAYKIDAEGVFPEISAFGEITTEADITSSEDGKAIDIKNVAVHSDLYSIDASGNLTLPENKASLKIDCTNCLRMIDDATSYYNRFQTFLRQVNPQAADPILTAAQIESIKHMIAGLDADPSTTEVVTLKYEQQNTGSTLSGQPIQQIFLQAMMILSAPPGTSPTPAAPAE